MQHEILTTLDDPAGIGQPLLGRQHVMQPRITRPGGHPGVAEIMLRRGIIYRITAVTRDPASDITILEAEVLDRQHDRTDRFGVTP